MLKIYSKPNCPACVDLKHALDLNEVPYQVVDITVDDTAMQELIDGGFRSVPQAMLNGEWVRDLMELI